MYCEAQTGGNNRRPSGQPERVKNSDGLDRSIIVEIKKNGWIQKILRE